MRDSGYVLGKDFVLEARYGDGDPKWLAAMAAELVKTNVEVIVTGGTPANYAAQAVTQTIPIVITNSPDPVGEGFARSLARPGGNITGFSTSTAEIDAKHVELLKASLPRLEVLAVFANPAQRGHRARMKSVEATAQRQGAKTLSLAADTVEAIEAAFTALRRGQADAVVVLSDTFYVQQARQIARLALELKLPSISISPVHAEAGGLMSYGQHITDNFRRAAKYVDRILKGAKPGELPIEQPTKFELVINLRTAKAIGLSIPSSVLLRADRVIQ